jgi:hypothetical protein
VQRIADPHASEVPSGPQSPSLGPEALPAPLGMAAEPSDLLVMFQPLAPMGMMTIRETAQGTVTDPWTVPRTVPPALSAMPQAPAPWAMATERWTGRRCWSEVVSLIQGCWTQARRSRGLRLRGHYSRGCWPPRAVLPRLGCGQAPCHRPVRSSVAEGHREGPPGKRAEASNRGDLRAHL